MAVWVNIRVDIVSAVPFDRPRSAFLIEDILKFIILINKVAYIVPALIDAIIYTFDSFLKPVARGIIT